MIQNIHIVFVVGICWAALSLNSCTDAVSSPIVNSNPASSIEELRNTSWYSTLLTDSQSKQLTILDSADCLLEFKDSTIAITFKQTKAVAGIRASPLKGIEVYYISLGISSAPIGNMATYIAALQNSEFWYNSSTKLYITFSNGEKQLVFSRKQ